MLQKIRKAASCPDVTLPALRGGRDFIHDKHPEHSQPSWAERPETQIVSICGTKQGSSFKKPHGIYHDKFLGRKSIRSV